MASSQNYTHILQIEIDDNVCNNDKNKLISFIYDNIHNKVISKNIMDTNIPIKWTVTNESKTTYYTDVKGMLGDRAVYLHTEMLSSNIKNKYPEPVDFVFTVTKPLMQQICML